MDICVYVHVNTIIRCEYNNGGGGGGGRVKLDKLGGAQCPKSLKTPGLDHRNLFFYFFLKNVIFFIFDYMSSVEDTRTTIKWHE